jgi:hypothetical protein
VVSSLQVLRLNFCDHFTSFMRAAWSAHETTLTTTTVSLIFHDHTVTVHSTQ